MIMVILQQVLVCSNRGYMNTKIAQEAGHPTYKENIKSNTYWDLVKPGGYPADASEKDKVFLDQLKEIFAKYLADFRTNFNPKQRVDYAVKKLIDRFSNTQINKGYKHSYQAAVYAFKNDFHNVIEEVKSEVKKEFDFGVEEGSLDDSFSLSGDPWTYTQWKNTLLMMFKRAKLQFEEIRKRDVNDENEENIKKIEMNIKKQYAAKVRFLISKLVKIRDGDNPKKKKLLPTDIIPDSWLGGSGGSGFGDLGGLGGRSPGGRRYPGGSGGAGGLDEGFTERDFQQTLKFPFARKGGGDYLYIQDLLKAYGLDGEPRYKILMNNIRALPGRPWRSNDAVGAKKTIGGDRGVFFKYVQALDSALAEILQRYIQDSENYNNQQAEFGNKYRSSVKHMMDRLSIPALESRKEEIAPYGKEEKGNAGGLVEQWKASTNRDKWGDYLQYQKGFKKVDNGWTKNTRNGLLFISINNGNIYRKVGNNWQPIGHVYKSENII